MQIVSIPDLQWRASLPCPLYLELPDGLSLPERSIFWEYAYKEIYDLSMAMNYPDMDIKGLGRMAEIFENHYNRQKNISKYNRQCVRI